MKHKRRSWVCIQCTESNTIDNSKPRHADVLINVSVLLCTAVLVVLNSFV